MDALVVIGRALLGVVFAISGFAKLVDRAGSRRSLVAFGVPAVLAGPLGLLLPLAEIAGAILVVPAATAWRAAAWLLALLLLFIAAIGVNLARGRTPDCHCFGQLHSAPIGAKTLARNAALAGVAAFVLSDQTQPSVGAAFGGIGVGGVWPMLAVLSTALSALTLFIVFHLVRQNGRLLMRLEAVEAKLGNAPAAPQSIERGLAVGTAAPAFDTPLQHLEGTRAPLASVVEAGSPVLLVFSEPGCGSCEAVLPRVADWQREHAARVQVVVISRGTLEQNRSRAASLGLRHVLLQADRELAEAYGVVGTPSAVLVVDGKVATPVAEGPDAVSQLAGEAGRLPLRRGTPAPEVRLATTEGEQVSLSTFRGRPVLLLFWNPGCGFCQAMLDDLRRWEREAANGRPRLVVVSSGTAEAIREQGFQAPVLVDEHFSTGPLFGVDGTPSAILIDEHGVVVSGVGQGAAGVFGLAGGRA